MSRLTGKDALGLFEAYNAVYVPQEELSEEQIWEEVEAWVTSLVEEGYDLSEFTWEEMYEEYITEIGVNFGGQAAVDRARAQQKAKSASDAKLAALRTQRFGSGGSPSAGRNSSGKPAAAKPAATTPAKPAKPTTPAATTPARPAAAPAARPAAAARPSAAPAARPAATSAAKPAPTAAAKPASAPAAAPKPVTQPPESKSQASAGEIRGMIGRSMERQAASTPAAAKPTPKPTPAATGSKKPGSIVSGFDMFDVVKGHLIGEGYADTEEAAIAIMANMSEEWKASILGEAITSEKGKAKAAEMIAKRSTPSGRAKSGQGANVATIKHISRSDREGLGGTPLNRKTAGSNRPKSYSGIGGTGNKAARRAGLTPTREKPNAWKEEFELWVNALVEEGYDLSGYTWDEMYEFYLDEGEKPFPHEKVKAKQVALRDKGGNALDRRMRMGAAVRRAKEAEKTGGSQRDAGKGWYHGR